MHATHHTSDILKELTLEALINSLAKSSAAAVRAGKLPPELQEVKDYLYIETEIEQVFKESIDNATNSTIIFLCGSSGDGKSELLSRYNQEYGSKFLFHLDGTHSYRPDQTAIEALDKRFREHQELQKPLIVGINIGMLANYCNEGADDLSKIKTAISRYLEKRVDEDDDNIEFINFELFPKFKEENGEITAPFIDSLLSKIVAKDSSNPFHRAYLNSVRQHSVVKSKLETNFAILSLSEIRIRLREILLVSRLRSDLFLTARTLLDFVHTMLSGGGYLFDNLYNGGSSELMKSLSLFSPHQLREKEIDMFIINKTLNLSDSDFKSFAQEVNAELGILPDSPVSWIRFFSIAQHLEVGNNYHHKFKKNFQQPALDHFIEVWGIHSSFNGEREQRTQLRDFYNNFLIKALQIYGNRLAPSLASNKEFILKILSGFEFSSKAEIQADLKRIEIDRQNHFGKFNAYLIVNGEKLQKLEVDANLMDLIRRIIKGYKPSKHDRDATVILEEFVELIRQKVDTQKQIIIRGKNCEYRVTYDEEYDEIQIH